MVQLHDEKSVISRIRKMAKGCTDLRIAVAFWGADGPKTLFLNGAKNGRIICNLESGACNPKEIRKLRASKKFKVRSHPQLHAKIYWSPQAAVIGSSNVSANGLVVGANLARGWREANLWFDQAELLRNTGNRFIGLWEEAKPITNLALKEAELKWKERVKTTKMLSIESKTLLKAFVEDPAAFRGHKIFLAMYDQDISPEAATAEKKWRSLNSTERFADGLIVKSTGMAAYEDWRKMPAGAWLIDCSFMNRKKPRFEGVYRVWEGGIVKLSESQIQFAYKTRSVVVGTRSFKLSEDEKRAIERHAKPLFRAARRRSGLLLEIGAVARICGLSRLGNS